MANPRIVYAGVTLDFPQLLSDYPRMRPRRGNANTSHGGVTETVRLGIWEEMRIFIDRFADRAFFRRLEGWYAHASTGGQFAFALDSARMAASTLVGAEAAGQTDLALVSATGFAETDEVIVESVTLNPRERHLIDSVSAPSIIVASPGLDRAFAAGDVVRHADYWPKLILIDGDRPFRELPTLSYTLDMRVREDRA
jgi:hypothetical protein